MSDLKADGLKKESKEWMRKTMWRLPEKIVIEIVKSYVYAHKAGSVLASCGKRSIDEGDIERLHKFLLTRYEA